MNNNNFNTNSKVSSCAKNSNTICRSDNLNYCINFTTDSIFIILITNISTIFSKCRNCIMSHNIRSSSYNNSNCTRNR